MKKNKLALFLLIALFTLVSCKKAETGKTAVQAVTQQLEAETETAEEIDAEYAKETDANSEQVTNIIDGYELRTPGSSDSAGHYSTDSSFSEGMAWVGYYDENGNRYVGVMDEGGKLVFAEEESKLSDFLGKGSFRNTLFEEGVSALYSNNSFMIIDNKGNILCAANETKNTEYHLMGYGDGAFPVIKTVKDISGDELEFLYSIDKTGKIVGTPSVWQGSCTDSQHVSYLENKVFTDGICLFDLDSNENYYFSGNLEYSLDKWIDIPEKIDITDELENNNSTLKVFNDYPMTRAYSYYGDKMGYTIRENVYGIEEIGPVETHYRFYNIDGTMIGDIPDTIGEKKVEKVGLYSGGYVPVELSDDKDEYITVLDMNGTPIYEPISESEKNIYGWDRDASYMGYTAVYVSDSESSLTLITPNGELKKIGDDLSELGNDAYMYTKSGCFIANGFITDLNQDGGGLAYEAGDEIAYNLYVSLDGKKVIKGTSLNDTTKSLDQNIKDVGDEYFDTTTILKKSLSQSSLKYDNSLAKILACMSEKAEKSQPDDIIDLYKLYGLYDIQDDNYDSDGGASAIARTKLQIDGADTDILVVTCRGSVTLEEFIGDWLKGPHDDKKDEFEGEQVFDNVSDMTDKVWAALEKYIEKYPELKNSNNLKIIINGHSLGGASASMVAARVNNQIKSGSLFNKSVTMESVYAYTFGGIEVFEENTNMSEGYENIHNLYNRYDAFGPEGNFAIFGASSCNAKFGHTEMFELDLEKSSISNINHWMSTYKAALELEDMNEEFIANCK